MQCALFLGFFSIQNKCFAFLDRQRCWVIKEAQSQMCWGVTVSYFLEVPRLYHVLHFKTLSIFLFKCFFNVRIQTVKVFLLLLKSINSKYTALWMQSVPYYPTLYLDCTCVHFESAEYNKLVHWHLVAFIFYKSKHFCRFQIKANVLLFLLSAWSWLSLTAACVATSQFQGQPGRS